MMKNPDKIISDLENEAHKLEDEMKYELFRIKRSSKKVVNISLLAGAGALAAVALVKIFSKEKKKPEQVIVESKKQSRQKSKTVQRESAFTSRIKAAVLAIVLEVGRRKMMDFLNKKFNDNRPSE